MKHLITILALISCISIAKAQVKIPPISHEVILFETIEKYCRDNSAAFLEWTRIYQQKILAERGSIYPKNSSAPIFSRSHNEQKRANRIAFYIAIRAENGDSLIALTHEYAVFAMNKPFIKKTKKFTGGKK